MAATTLAAPIAVARIVAELGGECVGDSSARIDHIGAIDRAGSSTITFIAQARYRAQLNACAAACVVVGPALRDEPSPCRARIVTPDPYLYYARLTQWWRRQVTEPAAAGIHPSAIVDPTAVVDTTARIGPGAVVGAQAWIGPGVDIGAHAVVGAQARVGAATRLAARVVVGEACTLGERCLVHSGAVIGADGFGFAPNAGAWEKIEQLGTVRIGNDVEIGANTCIDRGALDDTVIEDGVKLDNLIQIAHNVHVGRNTAMAACVGVAGSARIGAGCTVGGGAGILGHLELADGVHVSSFTLISRSIRQPGVYSGVFPFDENARWEKNAATLRQLHALRDRLRALEKPDQS